MQGLVLSLILLGIIGAASYTIIVPNLEDYDPPFEPTQVGIGTLSFVALLVVIAAVRLAHKNIVLSSPTLKRVQRAQLEECLQQFERITDRAENASSFQKLVQHEQTLAQLEKTVVHTLTPQYPDLLSRFHRKVEQPERLLKIREVFGAARELGRKRIEVIEKADACATNLRAVIKEL